MKPRDRLHRLLDTLEHELDPGVEREIEDRHRAALDYGEVDRLPVVVMCTAPLPEDLTPYPYSEIVVDPAKMLFNELVSAWDTSIANRGQIGDDLPATVRANFGITLVPSCFGATIDQPEDAPPWVRHFENQADLDAALDQGADLHSPSVRKAVEFMEFYAETLGRYSSLSRIVKITLPDLQGPIDSAAMLRGSEIFLDAASDPGYFTSVLTRMAETQIALWRRFFPLTRNEPAGYIHQHGVMVKGNILIRGDSSVMISPAMYQELVAPQDAAVLKAVGGGAIHSCGVIDHVVPEYLRHDALRCIDYGQSWMNQVDSHHEDAAAATSPVPLVRVRANRDELRSGSILDRFTTGVVLIHQTDSIEDAAETVDLYKGCARRGGA